MSLFHYVSEFFNRAATIAVWVASWNLINLVLPVDHSWYNAAVVTGGVALWAVTGEFSKNQPVHKDIGFRQVPIVRDPRLNY